ncbi:MAG: CotH kinase family protein, partial [Anaerolineae bacterium]|nr:CotH kinase family protein [Anaerolineae bacterium]
MKRTLQIFLSLLALIFLLFVSLYSLLPQGKTTTDSVDVWRKISKLYSNPDIPDREAVLKQELEDINNIPLQDNKSLYSEDAPDSVVVMYLTVRKGSSSSDTNHSWEEVNTASKFSSTLGYQVDVPKAEAILQVGDETGPLQGELGYGEVLPNAVVSVRGNTSSNSPQKSFKIELRDKGPDFRGQKTIALNKHVFDPTRAINKLSFDLIKELPDMVSLRTQYVHLYIKDETTNPPNKAFQDYGLFTQVEQPNKQFLKNHLLDRYGQLYKATSFEFYRYPDEIRSTDDPSYNEEAFSRILEIKGNRDHTKLIRMLDDINNQNISIKESFERYFNQDNYFTWMAFNILVGNLDTDTQNFYLYSPENSEKWYFIPWDYDGSFSRQDEKTKVFTDPWREGV